MTTRIITAIILLALFIPLLLFCSTQQWAFLVSILIGVCGWEFANLIGFNQTKIRIIFCITYSIFCLILYYIFNTEITNLKLFLESKYIYNCFIAITIFWSFVIPIILKFNILNKIKNHKIYLFKFAGIVFSFIVLFPTWISIIVLREISNLTLILCMAVVWIADSFAYFGGKRFGKHKLAINISPGKTIEGAITALISLVIYSLLINYFGLLKIFGNFGDSNENYIYYIFLVIFSIYIGIMSIFGDLFESYLKRLSNIKDSSQILPGHGGILDRIDSLTAALPISLFFIMHFAKV